MQERGQRRHPFPFERRRRHPLAIGRGQDTLGGQQTPFRLLVLDRRADMGQPCIEKTAGRRNNLVLCHIASHIQTVQQLGMGGCVTIHFPLRQRDPGTGAGQRADRASPMPRSMSARTSSRASVRSLTFIVAVVAAASAGTLPQGRE